LREKISIRVAVKKFEKGLTPATGALVIARNVVVERQSTDASKGQNI
jgi:hypothetical protein